MYSVTWNASVRSTAMAPGGCAGMVNVRTGGVPCSQCNAALVRERTVVREGGRPNCSVV